MKPILFTTEMVKAILDGRKTTTRRVKKQIGRASYAGTFEYHDKRQPYQPGDVLYVREKFALDGYEGGQKDYVYWADTDGMVLQWGKEKDEWAPVSDYNWHPSINMPKEAARIFLRVTDVKAERLQDITDEEAEKEGCNDPTSTAMGFPFVWDNTVKKADYGKYGWVANPWVWVISFERCKKPND